MAKENSIKDIVAAQKKRIREVPKFDYDTDVLTYSDLAGDLNRWASKGWKLHTLTLQTDGAWLAVFERAL